MNFWSEKTNKGVAHRIFVNMILKVFFKHCMVHKICQPSPSSGSLTPHVFCLSLKFVSIAMKRLYNHLRWNIIKCYGRREKDAYILSLDLFSHSGGRFWPGCGHARHSTTRAPSSRSSTGEGLCPAAPLFMSLIWRHCWTQCEISWYLYC